ncbi:uncharacterized protein LOC122956956 [Acropora millepora]|uniref:uncharacterized protein LOC122956956 n=1 Tax=Acropora millepora TaxID=45264 RepID=UPI001CF2587F|nr:uncharacterized protein LOC122956956 [Acropora millepora]XP_044172697.1 uncharacterized protein LOC122956956 [Acropora millepora]
MIPKIITVVFAINAISAANGFVNVDSKLRVLEPILKCYEGNAHEFAGLGTLVAHLNLDSDADDLELSCVHAKDSATCLADVLKDTPSPVPEVFLFYGAVTYQTAYLLKKANVCPGIKYDDLKRIVLRSGLMKKEGLSNIENDRYHKCAGDAIKKCLIKGVTQAFEHEQGDPGEVDNADDAYIRCIEEQTKTCRQPIMRHFLEVTEAYKKHVKQLEKLESEEQHG